MDNKGFTLIEISISVALLAVVLLFVINLLTVIRNNEDDISLETQLELNKSLISKTINSDILTNDGIKTITCESERSCIITLNNDEERRIYINNVTDNSNNYSVLHYEDVTDNKILFTRKSFQDYDYILSLNKKSLVTILTIQVVNHPFYNVDIVSKN